MAIVGGSADARGPVFGALFLVVLSDLVWSNFPQVYMIVLGALLIGFVLFAPNGVAGLFERRRAVVRHSIPTPCGQKINELACRSASISHAEQHSGVARPRNHKKPLKTLMFLGFFDL